MKFIELKYKLFKLKLSSPFHNSIQNIDSKAVLILRAKDEEGNFHFGEVSPLPDFSKENINDCVKELEELIKRKVLFTDLSELKENLEKFITLPSLFFGIEQLLFSKTFEQYKNNFEQKDSIEINAAIGIDEKEKTISRIDTLFKQGYRTFKIKIGRKNFNEDLLTLKTIHKKYGNGINLRLDNNGSWNYEEAVKNLELLENFNIQYIEQPVKSLSEIIDLAKTTNINIAPDESLDTYENTKNILQESYIKFLVLKPSIRIGLFDTIQLISEANRLDKNVIISSAFETVIGKTGLAYLTSLCKHNFAHGLNTELLKNDYLKSEINFNRPKLNMNNLSLSYQFRKNI